jgi:hypothetical protein
MYKTARLSLHVVLVSCLALLAGCSGKEDSEPAVATPSLSLSKDRVPIDSAVTLTYKFVVAPNATFDQDYWVFVHVLDTDGEQMWTDDHQPPTPTRQWKAGETIEYKRTVFVPNYPYIGAAVVRLGMYDPRSNKRLVLTGEDAGRREYVVAKVQILPSSDNIFKIYGDGWHPAEVDPKNPQNEWKWTKKTAIVKFRNPKKDSTLYLEFDARVDLFTSTQQVTLKIGDQVIGQFAADSKAPTLKTFPVTAAQLGTGEMVDLIIDVDRTFQPGGNDPRDLGIRVFHVYLEAK